MFYDDFSVTGVRPTSEPTGQLATPTPVGSEPKPIVPMNGQGVISDGKGTEVQHSSENPFYPKVDIDHFAKIGNGTDATNASGYLSRARARIAILYNEKYQLNPAAVSALQFPNIPVVSPEGKKSVRISTFERDVDDYERQCTELLKSVGQKTLVDEVRGAAQAVTDTVVAVGATNLAATLGVQESVLNGLSTVYAKMDSDTQTIISAVNDKGEKVLLAIDKATKKVTSTVVNSEETLRNKLVAMDTKNFRSFQDVHRHIDDKGQWVVDKVGDRLEDTNSRIDTGFNGVNDKLDNISSRLFPAWTPTIPPSITPPLAP